MADQPTVFKATYSNIEVYELMAKSIAVMRRREDDYMNATQILKVADFAKAQRTRILEREVQTGVHEKIQGGYGKYQGTWIPLDRAIELARRYDVFEILSPILLFQRGGASPPPAPKHSTSNTYKPKTPKVPKTAKMTKKQKLAMELEHQKQLAAINYMVPPLLNQGAGLVSTPGSGRSRPFVGYKQPPPTYYPPESSSSANHNQHYYLNGSESMTTVDEEEVMEDIDHDTYDSDEPYDVQLLRHFISGDNRVPTILLHPPSDLDFNIIIDDEGHTSLHWAAAMGHLKIVKLLLHHGADASRVNYRGQTALIRSVLFTNNFELRCFPHMLEMLRTTIFNIDKKDQTVFHHIAATAGWKGKVHASRYYMDCMMAKIRSRREDLVQILNVQDVYGDTALTIAARIGNKKLVQLLVGAGANALLVNEEGKRPQDYIMEFEGHQSLIFHLSGSDESIRKRAKRRVEEALQHMNNSTLLQPPPSSSSPTSAHDTNISHGSNTTTLPSKRQKLHHASPVLRDFTKIVDECINSYEREEEHKEQLSRDISIELQMAQKRLDTIRRTMDQLAYDDKTMADAETDGANLHQQLHQVIGFTQMIRLRQLIKKRQQPNIKSELLSSPPPRLKTEPAVTLSSPLRTSIALPSATPSASSTFLSSSPTITSSSVNNRTSSARTSALYGLSTSLGTSSSAQEHTLSHPSYSSISPSATSPKRKINSLIDSMDTTYDNQQALETRLKNLIQHRQGLVKEIMQLQGQTPNKRYQEYKRLISMCCNVNYENVDMMLSPLLASFEQTTQE
ncbi:hypothetical protein BCR42DRAFT_377292 [Absidia repens]|uniref:HTH APSES-type domain-containing protein n=1 Tax=Absidia repens TaxID=90262 RepID=A0A1X2ICJ3_9FUNG|nr:hypothetical protein BCR42DRAFT_377292 [Absidia repens]